MSLRVLVVNAGSSSLKLRLLGPEDEVEAAPDLSPDEPDALDEQLAAMPRPDAVGHRVVHGGDRFRDAVVLDDDVVAALRDLTDLAPLHQPLALDGIEAVGRALPDVPAVACFDTAFHATLPAPAFTYALPRAWREMGVRRYGFHGLSHAYASRRAGAPRVVTCHLGAGASLAAVRDGACVDTTMGFTPLEGLVMATRAGTVDPGALVWLLRHGVDADALEQGLDREGGLRGLAGDGDMRAVLARDDADARLALDAYVHRLRAAIAAMAAALGGLDALVFTGGVGEHAAEIRARVAEGLGFLGVRLDGERNARAHADAEIGADGAPVRALVITAREDLEVARLTREALS
ncbi:MAG TPA: acetate/propionate family kinase [Solirubrobacteraceae bacterium]|nr:acetate/propionate family kinase [Solirubrobacteraceae bacterium]